MFSHSLEKKEIRMLSLEKQQICLQLYVYFEKSSPWQPTERNTFVLDDAAAAQLFNQPSHGAGAQSHWLSPPQ